ncbi:PDR/VanB family oxidoreductase [Actinomycetospora soli]|uniref:PDR/VanB family oxidoreductase n=1 Tax=Actinomycetospora soli TaxID=2893887 RepID=UPI001E39E4AF|nr:PDR/VanB family oxidoreductase [Actinomycetospora soli]MCD2190551.1 PDR/VanB family oxidoreductase [Actinomycetospora soli]
MTETRVRVVEVVRESDVVRSLRLIREDGGPLGPYRAGAHIDVVGPTGVLRQYSLCNPPEEADSLTIAVKREASSRGGSAALHEVAVGSSLTIGAPRNLLSVADDADRHLLVAGGIGITPLLSMAYELHRRGADFALHYVARSRAEAAFVELLEHRVPFAARVHLHLGTPRAERAGALSAAVAELSASSHVYTCGPQGFMDAVRAAAAPVVGAGHVHVEAFVAAAVDSSADRSFTVELDTGEEFEIPADRTILSVLEENDVEVFTSCTEGVCGSCVSGLLAGEADHRDSCIPASERGERIALCVSRARSDRLVIELS